MNMMHEQLAYERNVAKAAHLQSYIDRFGAKAPKQNHNPERNWRDLWCTDRGFDVTNPFHEATASDFIPLNCTTPVWDGLSNQVYSTMSI